MIVLIIFDILIEKLKNAVRFEKKRFDKVKESKLCPAISSLSLCFDSFNAKAKSCCNCRFQTDSIISPI